MSKQLFGTDGIRGVAGEFPLDARTAHAFGAALGAWAAKHPSPEVLIGMDTRESGRWLAEQVAGGLGRCGVQVRFAGLLTTPGVAYLTRTGPFVAGVMISASHNPYQDNGIKVFDHSGYKLPDEEEGRMERDIFALLETGIEERRAELAVDGSLAAAYIDYLTSSFPSAMDGLKMVVDCAHGASAHIAPELFRRLGGDVVAHGCAPDGRNINLNCGALHVDGLREIVLRERAGVGIAYDGDADRAILVAASGKIIDGDSILLLCGRALKADGRLANDTVVATVMSNLGLERALASSGIRMLRTPVGDKYVLEEMLRTGSALGGEQSGHVIFREYATTGDGLLTSLCVLEVMRRSGLDLDALTEDLEIYPQRLVNVRVRQRRPLAELAAVGDEIRAAEEAFGPAGRVLVRFSGTEPLARVMVEGPDLASVENWANRIADVIRAELA